MEWHQPWLLELSEHELMHLHDDCRTKAKANYHAQRFGLARAWDGLAHEVLERARELASRDDTPQGQLSIGDLDEPTGAYSDRMEARTAVEDLYDRWMISRAAELARKAAGIE